MPRFTATSGATLLAILALSTGSALPASQTRASTEQENAAREIAEAVEACDRGASAPLDFTAVAPPVQYPELFPIDFDMEKVKALQSKCQQAWIGAPQHKRMHLQWMRVSVMLNESGTQLLAPQLRKLADQGSAEALYLLYQLHVLAKGDPSGGMKMVTEEEARTALLKAAEQGHITALWELVRLYRGSSMFDRDLRKSVLYARRVEGAPPQGMSSSPYEDSLRAEAPYTIATSTLEGEGFSETEKRAAFRFLKADMEAGGKSAARSAMVVATAMRRGIGTGKDPAAARRLLEARAEGHPEVRPVLADMLVKGEGGPEDVKRALELLGEAGSRPHPMAAQVRAEILMSGKLGGPRPQEAIRVLAGSRDVRNHILLAGLLIDYHPRLENADAIRDLLLKAADEGNHEAALALAKLKLSGNSQFSDEAGARPLLKPLADAGNREALWLYAATQYSHLGSTSYQPMRQAEGLSDAELRALIEEGIKKDESQAFLLKAKMLRRGILYPQDDRAATDMLVQAAGRDNVEALLLLGEAYDKGLGIREDRRKRLEAWRKAASLGSLEAKSKIANAFTFDTFDKLMTLEEGITWRIALYNNGYGRRFDAIGFGSGAEVEFMGLFMGRAMEAGADAVAEAVMNAFREAPAGLEEQNLVGLGKAFPPEVKIAIEKRLAREGFLEGQPTGFWGPDARKALSDWVDAQGPIVQEASAEARPMDETVEDTAAAISPEKIGLMWDAIRAEFDAARNDRQRREALAKVNLLAQYGNIDARWALLPNYHQHANVRRVVTVAEITRYGLDVMVSKPPGAEKAEFDFIFNTTQIYQDGKSGDLGEAIIATIRDDKRLQDPLVLGGMLKQFMFAPGACEAVLDAARRAAISGLGAEGCDETTLGALIAYARSAGPTEIDTRNRKAAAKSIEAMLDRASR